MIYRGRDHRVATDLMIKASKAVTDQELKEAADYFASIKPRSNIAVVETDTVPKTHVRDLFLAPMDGGEKEPIGQRVIEIPENVERFVSRDSRARFIAYVPVGSIQKGRALAASSDLRVQCAACRRSPRSAISLACQLLAQNQQRDEKIGHKLATAFNAAHVARKVGHDVSPVAALDVAVAEEQPQARSSDIPLQTSDSRTLCCSGVCPGISGVPFR